MKYLRCLVFLFSAILVSCNMTPEDNSGGHIKAEEVIKVKTDTVLIEGMKFNPALLKVNKGDTILFINKDIVDHDVTEENNEWTSGVIKVGESWKMEAVQNFNYYCSIHLVMKGTVEIN